MANEASTNGTASTETPTSLLEQFHATAEELGGLDDDGDEKPMVADDADKTKPAGTKPADWAALRHERREWNAKTDRINAEFAAREAAIAAREKASEATSREAILGHLESGNFDEAARAIGFRSWNDMNDQAARAFSSPGYKQTRQLAEEIARLEEERATEKRQRDTEQYEFQRQHAEREYVAYVDTSLKSSEDETVRTLSAEDPAFTGAVFGHMSAHYQQTGEELTPEEAAKVIVDGLKAKMARWLKVKSLGVQATVQQPEATQVAGSKKPARQTNTVARTRAAGEVPNAEFIKFAAREMRMAMDRDRRDGSF